MLDPLGLLKEPVACVNLVVDQKDLRVIISMMATCNDNAIIELTEEDQGFLVHH